MNLTSGEDVLLGVLYGDCLGAPYEFSAPDANAPVRVGPSVFGHPAGRGTDDIETTVAAARGLLDAAAVGELDRPYVHVGRRLVEWLRGGPADVGSTTRAGLSAFDRSGDPLTSGPVGASSVSNGSLMRSAPFALAYREVAVAAAVAAESSRVSHGHPVVVECVDAYVRLLRALLDGDTWMFEAQSADVRAAIDAALAGLERPASALACRGIGYAPYALSLAVWAAHSPLVGDFASGIEQIVRVGGDTDTNGAICGAVLAARHGFPAELSAQLDRDRVEELRSLADRLVALRAPGGGSSRRLSERFDRAVALASRLHGGQVRKGTTIPYLSHLLAVASLVLEHGGDEDQAIAGLLHDAIEDAGGVDAERRIVAEMGERVAVIVRACTDADTLPKPPWRTRKEAYLAHLQTSPPEALLVSLADKVHNARQLATDHDSVGDELWSRFNAGPADLEWYYRSLHRAFAERGCPSALVRELEIAIDRVWPSAPTPRVGR